MVCQLIQDHPRRCGENKEAQAIKVLCTGSPPQVRGKRNVRTSGFVFRGITPAGAGKTNTISPAVQVKLGSPPQVRGKLGVSML